MAGNKLIQVVYTRKLTKDESVSIKVATDDTAVIPDVISLLKEYTRYLTPAEVKKTGDMKKLYRLSEFSSDNFKRAQCYFEERDHLLDTLKTYLIEDSGDKNGSNA